LAKTKQKICDAALKLFNRDGLKNVRLQHIADEAFVSVGNLAYHYKNMEAILEVLYEGVTQKQRELLAEYRIVPLFDNLEKLFAGTFHLQQAYIFFYLDTLEIIRTYPKIGTAHRAHIQSKVSQMELMLDFNSARGALIPEPTENAYKQLARSLWRSMDFWHLQHTITEEKPATVENYSETIWQLLIPYFTEMGRREYIQMRQMPYRVFF